MTTEQQLIKEVIDAADKYVASQGYQPDSNTENEEYKKWKEAFDKLRDYSDSFSDIKNEYKNNLEFRTRAKMTLVNMTPNSGGEGSMVKFECQYNNDDSKEDNSFSKYTPFGNANFSITNEEVLKNLEVNKKYYFDITQVK